MAVKTINTEMLQKMFLAGAANLEAKKEYINELKLTIMSAAKEVNALENPDMVSVAKAISSGSLRGARGNSGVILSQLLRGFTKEIREYQEIDAAVLARACDRATATAYKAVMKPKEGTILTVAKGASQKAQAGRDLLRSSTVRLTPSREKKWIIQRSRRARELRW